MGTPDAAQYYRVVKEHDVVSVFVAPTGLRAIRQKDPEGLEADKCRENRWGPCGGVVEA